MAKNEQDGAGFGSQSRSCLEGNAYKKATPFLKRTVGDTPRQSDFPSGISTPYGRNARSVGGKTESASRVNAGFAGALPKGGKTPPEGKRK
jgi:hypothetical protein